MVRSQFAEIVLPPDHEERVGAADVDAFLRGAFSCVTATFVFEGRDEPDILCVNYRDDQDIGETICATIGARFFQGAALELLWRDGR